MNPLAWGRGDHRRLRVEDYPPAVLALVDARDGRRCEDCARAGLATPASEPLELDHRQPLAQGGDNHHLNLRWACRGHNRGRRDRPLELRPRLPRWARRRTGTPRGRRN